MSLQSFERAVSVTDFHRFETLLDKFYQSKDDDSAMEIAKQAAELLLSWMKELPSCSWRDRWVLSHKLIGQFTDPHNYSREIALLIIFIFEHFTVDTDHVYKLPAEFPELSASGQNADDLCKDVYFIKNALRGCTDGFALRACLDKYTVGEQTVDLLLDAAEPYTQTMRVRQLYVQYLGHRAPQAQKQITFDAAGCTRPIESRSGLEAALDECAPLPSGWIKRSPLLCTDPQYYALAPQHGEMSMPAGDASVTRFCATKRSSRTGVATLESAAVAELSDSTSSDFSIESSSDDDAEDFGLEAISPTRTMWQFVRELEYVPDGTLCIQCVELMWERVQPTKEKARRTWF